MSLSTNRSMLGIDTMILIHAYRSVFTTDQQKQDHEKCKAILKQLLKDNVAVCISTISVCEFMVKIPLSDRASMLNHLEDSFTIAPFNVRAAMIAACLVEDAKQLGNGQSGDRPILLADSKIIATLEAHGCGRIETFDQRFAKLAQKRFKHVNSLQIQPNLPGFKKDEVD